MPVVRSMAFLVLSITCICLLFSDDSHSKVTGSLGWYADNAEKLSDFIQVHGKKSDKLDSKHRPVAVFDWDNTVIKNDVGDAVMFWMLAHNQIRRPADWSKTSVFLTDDAIRALNSSCSLSMPDPLPTQEHSDCADTILAIYNEGKLPDGKTAAWKKNFNADTLEPAYAWAAHLAAGHSRQELRRIAKSAIEFNLSNPVGAKQKVGTREVDAYVRIYPQVKTLIKDLQRGGFDVWVVSASLQYYVETFAKHVGITADHVVGIRPVIDASGKVTSGLEECGTHPRGNQTLITYRQGKRCWINKVIFRLADSSEMMNKPSPTVFGAGDSDTDFFFMKDATGLRLAINRNKPELMCHAYANHDGKWLINPMFIGPKLKKEEPYDCAPFGLEAQEDRVFGN